MDRAGRRHRAAGHRLLNGAVGVAEPDADGMVMSAEMYEYRLSPVRPWQRLLERNPPRVIRAELPEPEISHGVRQLVGRSEHVRESSEEDCCPNDVTAEDGERGRHKSGRARPATPLADRRETPRALRHDPHDPR